MSHPDPTRDYTDDLPYDNNLVQGETIMSKKCETKNEDGTYKPEHIVTIYQLDKKGACEDGLNAVLKEFKMRIVKGMALSELYSWAEGQLRSRPEYLQWLRDNYPLEKRHKFNSLDYALVKPIDGSLHLIHKTAQYLLIIDGDGQLHLPPDIDPTLGLKLDSKGRLEV